MRKYLGCVAVLAMAFGSFQTASGAFVVDVNNQDFTLGSDNLVVVPGNLASFSGRVTDQGTGLDGTDRVGLTNSNPNLGDFFFSFDNSDFDSVTSPGMRLNQAGFPTRYAEIRYSVSDDPNTPGTLDTFVSGVNQLRLDGPGPINLTNNPFPAGNTDLISTSGTDQSFIIDIFSNDGVTTNTDFDFQFTAFRFDFFNDEAANVGIIYTLDEVRFANSISSAVPIPEPSSLACLGLFGAGALARRRKR